jgi:hypothetical protein
MSDILPLDCWVLGDEEDTGIIRVAKLMTVRDLKNLIRDNQPRFVNITAGDLRLWKVRASPCCEPMLHAQLGMLWKVSIPSSDLGI